MADELISRQAAMELCAEIPMWGNMVKMLLDCIPAVDAVEAGSCDGCIYSNRKRPQKCSCCRRNRDLKDCYKEG